MGTRETEAGLAVTSGAPYCGDGTLGAGRSEPPCSAPQCWEVRKHNSSEWCRFIRSNPDCRLDGGFLSYLEGVFCTFPPRLLPLAVTLYVRMGMGDALR